MIALWKIMHKVSLKPLNHIAMPALVLLPNTRRGKLFAARLGHRLAAVVSNDAQSLSTQNNDALVAKHMVYGGLAFW